MSGDLPSSWLDDPVDPAAEALAATGARLRIGRIVTGGPAGEIRFTSVVADGAVTYEPGVGDDADITLTDTFANATSQVEGELDPNAAFMRGQTKVTGPTGPIVALMAATRSERYEEACCKVRSAR